MIQKSVTAHKKWRRRIWLVAILAVVIVASTLVVSWLFFISPASHLDMAKRLYETALQSDNPLLHYKAALEELDAAIYRDGNLLQAYAIKGLIYRKLEDFDLAVEYFEIASQGSLGGKLQWVPLVLNLTYGDIFHALAISAIQSCNWKSAKGYQETALEFFDNVITYSSTSLGEEFQRDEPGFTMQDIYIEAQGRWAAGKFQMGAIAGRLESKERQSELLREAVMRLEALVEAYPGMAFLRYYLADGYYKQSLTIKNSDRPESKRLQEKSISQLQIVAELGLPADLRGHAAELERKLTKDTVLVSRDDQNILATEDSYQNKTLPYLSEMNKEEVIQIFESMSGSLLQQSEQYLTTRLPETPKVFTYVVVSHFVVNMFGNTRKVAEFAISQPIHLPDFIDVVPSNEELEEFFDDQRLQSIRIEFPERYEDFSHDDKKKMRSYYRPLYYTLFVKEPFVSEMLVVEIQRQNYKRIIEDFELFPLFKHAIESIPSASRQNALWNAVTKIRKDTIEELWKKGYTKQLFKEAKTHPAITDLIGNIKTRVRSKIDLD